MIHIALILMAIDQKLLFYFFYYFFIFYLMRRKILLQEQTETTRGVQKTDKPKKKAETGRTKSNFLVRFRFEFLEIEIFWFHFW